MAKLSSLINLGTAVKVGGGVIAGSLATVGAQRYTSSSEEPAKTEMREEQQQKKLKFEVEQRSNELNQKEQSLKALEEALARREAALKEERSAMQQMQQTATAAVAAKSAATVAVETVGMSEKIPSESEAQKQEVITPTPADNTPKRPAVFDGGNKEPAAPVDDKKKPSVAFGSSGDVVTSGKGDAIPDAEMERLRKEVEDLRRRLAEKDDSPKEEALEEREVREKTIEVPEKKIGDDEPMRKEKLLEESHEVEITISGSPEKNRAHSEPEIEQKVPSSHMVEPNISSGDPNVPASNSKSEEFEKIPIRTRKADAGKQSDNRINHEQTPTPTPVVAVTSSSSGVPPPPPPPPPPSPGVFTTCVGKRLTTKDVVQKLQKDVMPVGKLVEKKLKDEKEKKRKAAENAKLVESVTEWHPIAMALKYVKALDEDDKNIKENEIRKAKKEELLPVLNRNRFKQNVCISLNKSAKDLLKSFKTYRFNDCMMRLLLMFDTLTKPNERTVLEIFQEVLSSFWLNAFAYFVTTPEDELKREYAAYKQEMIKRIEQTSDEKWCCFGFQNGTIDCYDSYEECCSNCVNFVVFDEKTNRTYSDSMYAGLLYRYVSLCDRVATCRKTDLVTLRNDYIVRLAKLLLREKYATGARNDSAYRNSLLKSVIEEVTSNCVAQSLTEDEKKHKRKEIKILILMNKDSLFKETADPEKLGTKEGVCRFVKIVEKALSRMSVSKAEEDNWLSNLDADLFSLFGITAESKPRMPADKKWFSDTFIRKNLDDLEKARKAKKDADLTELNQMVTIFFWQNIRNNVLDKSGAFYQSLNSGLWGSDAIVSRFKIRDELKKIKETELEKVLINLQNTWNTLVKEFEGKASILKMTTTEKDDRGNTVGSFGPMTQEYFKKLMSELADVLKLKTYKDLAENERKAYGMAKLFPIASKLRKSVIDSRNNNSDTLTIKFDETEYECMKAASSRCKNLLKLVLSYAKVEKLVLEGPWICKFLASCPKHNIKSLTLKDSDFDIGCLGLISTSIDEVTLERINLRTLEALEQFFYMEKGNSLTLENVTCREDYYEGEPGAVKDIQDNGAEVKIKGCPWYKKGIRPASKPTPETTDTTTTSTGGVPKTESKKPDPKDLFGPRRKFKLPDPKPEATGGESESSSKDPFGPRKTFSKMSPTSESKTDAEEGNPFLGGKKLKSKPKEKAEIGKTGESDPFLAVRNKMKKGAKTEDGATKKDSGNPFRGLLKKNVMHKGMLDKADKKDFEKKLQNDGIIQGKDVETALLDRLEREWDSLPLGSDIPVDVSYRKEYLETILKKAVPRANDNNASVVLSGDFEKKSDVTFDEKAEMPGLAKALQDARKIKTDIKSLYGINISFQGKLLCAMGVLKNKDKNSVKTEELDVSGWAQTSEDSRKVLDAVGRLGLKKFSLSYMDQDVLGKSDFFSFSSNKKAWRKIFENTENVSFKRQKMNRDALGGIKAVLDDMQKRRQKAGNIELPKQKSKTSEEALTEAILNALKSP